MRVGRAVKSSRQAVWLRMAPCRCGYKPVYNVERDGALVGVVVNMRSKRMPSPASASICGVWTSAFP